jgi:hypothetical protein
MLADLGEQAAIFRLERLMTLHQRVMIRTQPITPRSEKLNSL